MMLRKSFRTGKKIPEYARGKFDGIVSTYVSFFLPGDTKKLAKERRTLMEQTGTFNPKKFYEILAGILSRKYGVKITVQEIKKAA